MPNNRISFNTGRTSPLGYQAGFEPVSPVKTQDELVDETRKFRPVNWQTMKNMFSKAKNIYNKVQVRNPDRVDAIAGALAALGQGYSSKGGPGDVLGQFVINKIEDEHQSRSAIAYDKYVDAKLSGEEPDEQTIKDLSRNPELLFQANQYIDQMELTMENNAVYNRLAKGVMVADTEEDLDKLVEQIGQIGGIDTEVQNDLVDLINERRKEIMVQQSRAAYADAYNEVKNFDYSSGKFPEIDRDKLTLLEEEEITNLTDMATKMQKSQMLEESKEQFNEAFASYGEEGFNIKDYPLVEASEWKVIQDINKADLQLSDVDKSILSNAMATVKHARETISYDVFKKTMSDVYDKMTDDQKEKAKKDKNVLMMALLFSNIKIAPNEVTRAIEGIKGSLEAIGMDKDKIADIINTIGDFPLPEELGDDGEDNEDNEDEETKVPPPPNTTNITINPNDYRNENGTKDTPKIINDAILKELETEIEDEDEQK